MKVKMTCPFCGKDHCVEETESGYHCALRRAMGYVINDNGSVGTRLFNISGNNDKLTLESDIGSNKTKRLRICLRPDWNNGSYSCQIQEITISAQKAVSGTSANNEVADVVSKSLSYSESLPEGAIRGHQIIRDGSAWKASMLHLVDKQTFNAPIAFSVTGKSWYVRNPETETGYVDKVGNFSQRNQRKQARLRCIYENGTESDILRNSLAKPMYSDGKIVTENYEEALKEFSGVTEEDKPSGYIYVLRSLSKDPQVKAVKDLYKIGYSETTVEDRIRNAANETTYLMAKVKVVSSYKMYNVNTQKFEDLLHRFFDAARLSIDVMDNNGTRHTVREWFQVPLGVIEQAIYLFQTGDIVKYQYSREDREIVEI